MKNAKITAQGDLEIWPSPGSSRNDFNFLLGHHYVHHKKLKKRLQNNKEWFEFYGTKETGMALSGLGIIEHHKMNIPGEEDYEGLALRLFNTENRLWYIYWADNNKGVLEEPLVGSFIGDMGYFYAKVSLMNQQILMHFLWDARNPYNPVWSQAFSEDSGDTWEWNWYMHFSKTEY